MVIVLWRALTLIGIVYCGVKATRIVYQADVVLSVVVACAFVAIAIHAVVDWLEAA